VFGEGIELIEGTTRGIQFRGRAGYAVFSMPGLEGSASMPTQLFGVVPDTLRLVSVCRQRDEGAVIVTAFA